MLSAIGAAGMALCRSSSRAGLVWSFPRYATSCGSSRSSASSTTATHARCSAPCWRRSALQWWSRNSSSTRTDRVLVVACRRSICVNCLIGFLRS
ncbi:hypothetical protein PF005_g10454 [Phytophthora fragariae]|uniref:Uncharacterized protein n=1 Tax=Phytophthora fragariae TaxID=53985 RepID=A0A6A3TRN3_9STRA|nr:hypothetical protein PF003_g15074 [Phytophthora fragariae]KAE9135563.1 hypothetical protein PF007_g2498 [Phytophthora fragariae]KAE9203885.1 hypothetical protein PF002_g20806 [Phytophthora fragariae]KAE9212770.1 hypothetical protein PF005_g10454 [Phytophthora fragariae]KAE9228300.1 hypothetical protein PF004_g11108 [Phytophthora fragariae]